MTHTRRLFVMITVFMEELILKDVRAELDGQADAVEFVSIIDKHNEEVKWRRSIDFINMIALMLNRLFVFFPTTSRND